MSASSKSAEIHRKYIHDTLVSMGRYEPLDGATENDFHAHLLIRYRQLKMELRDVDLYQHRAQWVELYYYAVGLLTFGHLSVVEDIVGAVIMKEQRRATIMDMLPAPDDVNTYFWAQEFLIWFRVHRSRLVWDSEKSEFVMNDETG